MDTGRSRFSSAVMALYFPAGGHFNAALTAGAWTARQCTLAVAVLYLGVQVLGTAFGVEIARHAIDSRLHKHFSTVTPAYMSEGYAPAFVYEVICSVIMTLVQLGICQSFDKRFVVASSVVVALTKYTGASMDPLAPTSAAVFARDAIYLVEIGWFGGIVGGAIAGCIWRRVRVETS
jgi:glycerol uptake facilitator-like aquaporin